MKPTVVFSCGLWCDESIYEPIAKELRAKGYKTEIPVWPSNGTISPGNPSMLDDMKAFGKAVEAVLARGEDVFMVAHSAGAFVGGGGIKGLLKKDKPAGEPSVVGAILIAGAVIPPGMAHFCPPFCEDVDGQRFCKDPATVLFNDVSDKNEQQKWIKAMKSAPSDDWDAVVEYCPYPDLPNTYVVTEKDNCLPPAIQDQFMTITKSKKVVKIPAGHMAPCTAPDTCTAAIEEALAEYS